MSQALPSFRPSPLPWSLALLAGLISIWAGPEAALADGPATPIGSEFLVNTYTTDQQASPAVVDTTNGFMAVWHGDTSGGDGYEIRARFLDTSGTPFSAELQVNTTTTGTQAYPDVASRSDGSFMVVWHSDASGSYDILGQRFDSSGAFLGVELPLSAMTSAVQMRPKVAAGAAGDFLLVWQSTGVGGSDIGSRLLASNGMPLGAETTQVNEITTGYQGLPDVAGLSDGRFIVVWQGGEDGSGSAEIQGRIMDSTGAPTDSDLVLVSSTAGDQLTPAVAAGTSGGYFVVTWESDEHDAYGSEIKALGFDSTGMPIGSEVQVSTVSTTNGNQTLPDLVIDANNDVVFIWRDRGEPPPELDRLGSPIYIRSRTGSGPPFSFFQNEPGVFLDSEPFGGAGDVLAILNDQFQGPLVTAPTVAKDPNGGFLAVWEGPDGGSNGIRARKAETPDKAIFTDGFESGDTSSWSSGVR